MTSILMERAPNILTRKAWDASLGCDIRVDKIDFEQTGAICLDIRRRVFIKGQDVPEARDLDGLDNECDHYILWADNAPAGTARVYYHQQTATIERVAVLEQYRGKGYGRSLMLHIITDIISPAHHGRCQRILIGAQTRVQPFYESLGFNVNGSPYHDSGIPHVPMELSLTR